MSNRTPLTKLSISGEKSAQADIEQPDKWSGAVPEDFGAEPKPPSPNKRIRRVAAVDSTKKNEHGNLAAAAASTKKDEHIDLAAAREASLALDREYDKYVAADEAMSFENRGEDEVLNETTPVMGEQSPTMEDEEVSFFPADFSAGGKSALDELGADFGNDSDIDSETNGNTYEDNLPVDAVCTSRSISSDAASDIASEVRNNMVESTNTESSQGLEANIQEICRERDVLRKELESRDERIAALEIQNAALMNRTATTMTSADASTSTETLPRQVWQPNYPREGDNEQQLITTKQTLSLPPLYSLAMQTTMVARFIHVCLDIAKNLHLAFTSLVGMASLPGQELFLSCVGRSASFKGTVDFVQDTVRATVVYLATPVCMAMSVAILMSVQHEKNTWMQANALTRKHLLRHASGVSGTWDWDWFFTIGSMAYRY